MNHPKHALIALACVTVITSQGIAHSQQLNAVCANPSRACESSYSFATYQLPFVIKQKLVFGKTYRSVPFYAVILQSVAANSNGDCAHISEKQRLAAQTLFPDRKVFASRFSCAEELVRYTNVKQDFNFVAVYAGATPVEASRTLNQVKSAGRYQQAYLRKMQVVLEFSS